MTVLTGFSGVNAAIEADFAERLPGYHKSRREGLALLSSQGDSVKTYQNMAIARFRSS